jgi:hypothetical protein
MDEKTSRNADTRRGPKERPARWRATGTDAERSRNRICMSKFVASHVVRKQIVLSTRIHEPKPPRISFGMTCDPFRRGSGYNEPSIHKVGWVWPTESFLQHSPPPQNPHSRRWRVRQVIGTKCGFRFVRDIEKICPRPRTAGCKLYL